MAQSEAIGKDRGGRYLAAGYLTSSGSACQASGEGSSSVFFPNYGK